MKNEIRQAMAAWVDGAEFSFVRGDLAFITYLDIRAIRARGENEIPAEWGTDEEIAAFVRTQSYCTQNGGDCMTCSLRNYRRDCMNNPIEARGGVV